MTVWLLKTEPHDFSFDDLVERGVEPWDGISSPQALRNLQAAREGETVVIYHTGDERRVVGLGQVTRSAYPDPNKDNPRLIVIDVRASQPLPNPVGLDRLRTDPRFADSPLIKMGRLSVVALTDEQYAAILEMAGL
jgi:predicted RNA-binding protein with PUA-like domain